MFDFSTFDVTTFDWAAQVAAQVQLPFNQYDWSAPRRLRASVVLTAPLNLNLYTNPYPFRQFDYPQFRSKRQRPIPNADTAYNPNLYSPIIPFNQYDFSKPVRQIALTNRDRLFNPNLQTNLYPVANQDYFRPVFHRLPLIDLPPPLNINIFVPPPPAHPPTLAFVVDRMAYLAAPLEFMMFRAKAVDSPRYQVGDGDLQVYRAKSVDYPVFKALASSSIVQKDP